MKYIISVISLLTLSACFSSPKVDTCYFKKSTVYPDGTELKVTKVYNIDYEYMIYLGKPFGWSDTTHINYNLRFFFDDFDEIECHK